MGPGKKTDNPYKIHSETNPQIHPERAPIGLSGEANQLSVQEVFREAQDLVRLCDQKLEARHKEAGQESVSRPEDDDPEVIEAAAALQEKLKEATKRQQENRNQTVDLLIQKLEEYKWAEKGQYTKENLSAVVKDALRYGELQMNELNGELTPEEYTEWSELAENNSKAYDTLQNIDFITQIRESDKAAEANAAHLDALLNDPDFGNDLSLILRCTKTGADDYTRLSPEVMKSTETHLRKTGRFEKMMDAIKRFKVTTLSSGETVPYWNTEPDDANDNRDRRFELQSKTRVLSEILKLYGNGIYDPETYSTPRDSFGSGRAKKDVSISPPVSKETFYQGRNIKLELQNAESQVMNAIRGMDSVQ
jgi:hypothetical protein